LCVIQKHEKLGCQSPIRADAPSKKLWVVTMTTRRYLVPKHVGLWI